MESTKQTRRTPSRDVDADLGRRAHMLMWDQRITNKQLAARLGVDSTGLGKKLKGERGWALAEIVSLAEELDTTVAFLVGEAENPHQGPGGGSSLPGLDSNQEPAGFMPSAQPIVSLAERRAAKESAA